MVEVIQKIDKSSTLASFTNKFFAEESERFKNTFSNSKAIKVADKVKINKSIETVTNLTEEQAKNYALGVLIHACDVSQSENINLDSFIKTLKTKGVNINDSVNDITLIRYVIGNTNALGSLEILLQNGADVNLPNEYGHTALSFAVYNKDLNSINALIKNEELHVDKDSAKFILQEYVSKQPPRTPIIDEERLKRYYRSSC
ncbi:MAG: ankyrin repeat domain-containing protein [Candidatus Rickettsia vulgarisii]